MERFYLLSEGPSQNSLSPFLLCYSVFLASSVSLSPSLLFLSLILHATLSVGLLPPSLNPSSLLFTDLTSRHIVWANYHLYCASADTPSSSPILPSGVSPAVHLRRPYCPLLSILPPVMPRSTFFSVFLGQGVISILRRVLVPTWAACLQSTRFCQQITV